MNKYFLLLVFLLVGIFSQAQSTDPLVSNCVMNAGPDTRYLKDFRIQLAQGSPSADMRYKAQMSLWKNTKYRFSLCNSDESQGQLILTIKDVANKEILSSFDKKTGKIYPFIDFICNKSGIYTLNFDIDGGKQGSGVCVVFIVR